ncbi:MAG: S-layer homology domain-containing protein [Acidimicrobiia bacterium]|nr:S-layer homology domain-containing protein [Acidimicrobiia bacterium]
MDDNDPQRAIEPVMAPSDSSCGDPEPHRRRRSLAHWGQVRRLIVGVLALGVFGVVCGSAGAAMVARSGGFSDVPPGHPFAAEINWMAANDIAGGFPDGSFRPTDPVSRQAFAAFLARYAGSGRWVANGLLGEVKSGTILEASAVCPSGTMPVAGGAGASSHVVLNTNAPLLTGPTRGWRAEWRTPAGTATTANVQVWAYCVPVAP